MTGFEDLPLFDDATPWEVVQAALTEAGLGDGLPMVPPTRRRLDRMLSGVRDPNRSYGMVAPLFGELTPAAVAYQCVLAGCEPEELPVVLSAVAATADPDFNLLGIQTTTGTPTVAVLVHGPAISRLGMNSGTNCLGPGNRANACIGRAVQLVLVNIGGAKPLVGDMATMGQPGKYTFCFAEGEDPLVPPLHVRRGFSAEDDAVTVLGVSGTAEVLPSDDRDTPEAILTPVRAAMISAREVTLGSHERPAGEQFFLLPSELAQLIAKHGWDLAAVQNYLFHGDGTQPARRPVAASPADIHPVITGGAGIKMTYVPLWMGGTRSVTTAIVQP